MKNILFASLCIISSVAHAMIELPTTQELERRLEQHGFTHLLKNSSILKTFGGATINPQDCIAAVQKLVTSYYLQITVKTSRSRNSNNEINEHAEAFVSFLQADRIIKILLRDHPLVLMYADIHCALKEYPSDKTIQLPSQERLTMHLNKHGLTAISNDPTIMQLLSNAKTTPAKIFGHLTSIKMPIGLTHAQYFLLAECVLCDYPEECKKIIALSKSLYSYIHQISGTKTNRQQMINLNRS